MLHAIHNYFRKHSSTIYLTSDGLDTENLEDCSIFIETRCDPETIQDQEDKI